MTPSQNAKADLIRDMDQGADQRDLWKRKNRYYHQQIESLCASLIPSGSQILEIGCSTGGLLAALKPARGLGIDFSPRCVAIAKERFPHLDFAVQDAESLECRGPFNYVILSDLLGYLDDVWAVFRSLRRVTHPGSRLIITYYNALWEPLLRAAQWLGLKTPQTSQNWLSLDDIENQLNLNGYEVDRKSVV